jgi:hypothetical protein
LRHPVKPSVIPLNPLQCTGSFVASYLFYLLCENPSDRLFSNPSSEFGSLRMTALFGWSGTAKFHENWVYDQAADTYALDSEMAEKLKKANPEAFRNIVGRMLEANGRGFWQPDEEKLKELRALYDVADEQLEGVGV